MTITGNISQFSLPEVFEMIDSVDKSGLLLLTTENNKNYHIWFKKGKIVAAANRLNCQGLLSIIKHRSWIDHPELLECLKKENLTMPLGEFLQEKGLINHNDLLTLFKLQVLREVIPLFQIKKADFRLYENVSAPMVELTGITISVKELLLKSLRVLPNWKALEEKLPYSGSTLQNKIINYNYDQITLGVEEEKVWEFTKQNLTVNKIAEKLSLKVEKVQQIAFRLIVIGFVEEIPLVVASNSPNPNTNQPLNVDQQPTSSYLYNLLSFLNHQQVA